MQRQCISGFSRTRANKMVHYKKILDIPSDSLKVDPKSVVSKQKCIDYIEKLPLMVIFLYIYTFYVDTLLAKQKCANYIEK